MADDASPYKPDKAPKASPASGPARATGGKGKTKPVRELMPLDKLSESLKEKWTLLGMGVYSRNETDGLILLGGTDELIDSFVTLAERNIRVRRALDKLANAGEGVTIFLPMFNMANAIAYNHGVRTGLPLLASIDSYAQKAQAHVDFADDEYDENMDADLDDSPIA